MFEVDNIGKLDIEALNKARSEGKKIGLVQGSWDSFHYGHLRYIKMAKENCDYLILGLDSDAKIQKRKGMNRPLIPEEERYAMIKELGINKKKTYEPGKSLVDDIVIKPVDEEKWGLIKQVRPDVLVTITENYTTEEYNKLTEICDSVLVLPRQAETSTTNILRKKMIANMADKVDNYKELYDQSLENTKNKTKLNELMEEPYPFMNEHLANSNDWKEQVVAAAKVKNKWYYGTNQCDYTISKKDLNERTELFYSTVEHAEINLLKRISEIGETDTVYVSLFPCDKCMKTLINKGIKNIYYLSDHLDRNWSKRSHELALQKGVNLINVNNVVEKQNEILKEESNVSETKRDYSNYKYIYPPNAREQEQLDIMIEREKNGQDPFDPNIIDQDIIYTGKNWYVSENRFKYDGVEHQFLITALNPIYKVEDITEEMWTELGKICLAFKKEYNIPGGALCFRFGDCSFSGASLKRLHAHLIQPKEEEKTKFTIGGKKELKKELKIKD